MNPLIQQATELRNQGKTFREISEIQNCSISTALWRASPTNREKHRQTQKDYAKSQPAYKKFWQFKSRNRSAAKVKVRSFRFRDGSSVGKDSQHEFTLKDVTNKFGPNPKCYLTGRPLDWENPSTYSFDHIVPATKGGDNSLSNMGLVCREANQAKSDLRVDEFLALCQEVLTNYGFTVSK